MGSGLPSSHQRAMKPYDDNIQTFAAMFDGYDQARA
jgi:hypothetical protein